MRLQTPLYSLAFLFLGLGLSLGAGEPTEKESAEDAEAAEEERKLEAAGLIPDGGYEFEQEGRLALANYVMDKERPSVVGVFNSRGRTYQLKLEKESLRKELAKFNGKKVTLGGKVRNKGKYLIVQEVLSENVTAGPGERRRTPGRM